MIRTFTLLSGLDAEAYLLQVCGEHPGVKLPLQRGLNPLIRVKGACQYRERDALRGIIEAAQILLRLEGPEAWVADATSTNQTFLVREPASDAGRYWQAYRGGALKPSSKVTEIVWESPRPPAERRWYPLTSSDLLVHMYGCWTLDRSFTLTPPPD